MQGDVTGREVQLRSRARVTGDVHADRVLRHPSSVVGGLVGPFLSPPEPIPDVGPVPFGGASVTVRGAQPRVLAPGSYADVKVENGARLVLAGGTYQLRSLKVSPQAVVEVRAAVVVRVASKLELEHHARVLPAAGVAPSDVRWESLDRESRLGPDVQFVGVLVAPDGEVRVGQGAHVSGQVLAERVRLGPCAVIVAPPAAGGGGGGTSETTTNYVVNAVNEYTNVGGVARTHDDNGNLTDDGSKLLAFDYKNRLVMATRKADLRPVAIYGYLPDGRRSRKQVFDPDSGSLVKDTRFLSDGAQEVEEQDWSTGVTTCTYVWSSTDIDGLIQFERTSAHELGAGTFYVHQDARANVVAVTNASGAVVERRRYDDFGKVEFRDGSGVVVAASVVALDTGFQGRRLDQETGWVYFRARYYDPATGRFLQRDPVWDAANVGGQYTFCGNGPASGRDPRGLQGDPAAVGSPSSTAPVQSAGTAPVATTTPVAALTVAQRLENATWLAKGIAPPGVPVPVIFLTGYARLGGTPPTGTETNMGQILVNWTAVDGYLRQAFQALRNFARGHGPAPRDTATQLRAPVLDASISALAVQAAVRRLVNKLESLMAAGDTETIFIHGCLKPGAMSEYRRRLSGSIIVDPARSWNDRDIAVSVFHELMHKFGDIREGYSHADANGNGVLDPAELAVEQKDHAQLIVEQFF